MSASAGPAETDGPRTRGLRRFSVGELRGGPSTSPSRDTRSRICRLPAVSGPACHQGSPSASGCGKRQHTHCACLINGRSANLVVCLSVQIQQLTLSSELALVANTGCLGSYRRGPWPLFAQALPLTAPAWLPMSESRGPATAPEPSRECCSFVEGEACGAGWPVTSNREWSLGGCVPVGERVDGS